MVAKAPVVEGLVGCVTHAAGGDLTEWQAGSAVGGRRRTAEARHVISLKSSMVASVRSLQKNIV